jgi:hypothetical protein
MLFVPAYPLLREASVVFRDGVGGLRRKGEHEGDVSHGKVLEGMAKRSRDRGGLLEPRRA